MYLRLMVTALAVMLCGKSYAQINEVKQVARIDGSLIDVHIRRPQGKQKSPALIAIDGPFALPQH